MYFYLFTWCDIGFYCWVCSLESSTAQYLFSSLQAARTCALCQWLVPLPVPLGIASCAAWDGAVPLWAGQGHLHTLSCKEELLQTYRPLWGGVMWALRKPQTSLHHLTFTHNSLAWGSPSDATHSPLVPLAGCLVLGWQAGHWWECPAAWGGISHLGSLRCVPDTSPAAPGQEQRVALTAGEMQSCNRPTPSTGEQGAGQGGEAGRRTLMVFLAFILTFTSWVLWGFAGFFGWFGVFGFVLVFASQIKPRSLVLSLTFSSHLCLLKISLICFSSQKFCSTFCVQAHSSGKTGGSNHQRLLTAGKQSGSKAIWQMRTYPGRMLLFHLLPKINVHLQKPEVINLGCVYTWNGKAVFKWRQKKSNDEIVFILGCVPSQRCASTEPQPLSNHSHPCPETGAKNRNGNGSELCSVVKWMYERAFIWKPELLPGLLTVHLYKYK